MQEEFKSNPLKTMLVICLGFLVLFLLFSSVFFLWVSTLAALAGILSEKLSKRIETVWFSIARIASANFPPILLALVYFCIVFPLGLLSRLFRKNDLLDLKNTRKTMFKDHMIQYNKTYFENMW